VFCSKCGTENQAEASYCHKCGTSLSNIGVQQNIHASVAASDQSSAIWNPNAAANWSLVFSPAFGSYLQMLNWKALGQSDKAASSQNWFYASLAILVVYVLMGVFMSDSSAADGATRGLGFLYLLVWYFSAGRSQGKFVKEKFGSNYPKKPWGKALLIGIAAIIGYLIFAVVVGLILGAAS
jgi:hypothetical protein